MEMDRTDVEVVAVQRSRPGGRPIAHLLRYDGVHGRFPGTVTVPGENTIDLGRGSDPRHL